MISNENSLALIEHRLSSIEDSHGDLKDAIKELTVAIHKLAVIDERQIQSALVLDKLSQAVDKAHSRIDGLTSEFAKALERAKQDCSAHVKTIESRLSELEKTEPMQKKTTEWVDKVQWLVVGTVLTAIVGMVVVRQ